jgi:hypothetical protein
MGVVAAIATGFLVEHLPWPRWGRAPQQDPSEPGYDPQTIVEWRLRNQNVWKERYAQAFFYGATFYFLYMAIAFPFGLIMHPMDAEVNLSTTRLHLNRVLDVESAKGMAAMLALLFHLFLWRGAVWAAEHIKGALNPVMGMPLLKFGAVASALIAVAALFIAGNLYYMVDPSADYLRSIMMPFIVVGFSFVMMSAFAKR